jgi:hypothetical protein
VPQLNGSSAAAGLLQYPNPYWVDSEEPSDAPFVDPDVDVPFSARPMFMPLITR